MRVLRRIHHLRWLLLLAPLLAVAAPAGAAPTDPSLTTLQSILTDLREGRLVTPSLSLSQAKQQLALLRALDAEIQRQIQHEIQRGQPGHAPPPAAPLPAALDNSAGPPMAMLRPIAHPVGAAQAAPGPVLYIPSAQGAAVQAGCAGRVLYAGAFRSYGQLVILDCGGNTRLVLGGLDHLKVGQGARVARGQVLGAMPHDPGPPPRLYLEVRRGDSPADPQIFFHARYRSGLIDSARSGVR